MSNMTKILLIGSVGLIGAGAFVWWRGRKLARETATELFSSGASTGAAVPSLKLTHGYKITKFAER
jgi:hypothetical protein